MRNAYINTTLEELFDILDARKCVTIFRATGEDSNELLRETNLYNLLGDVDFLGKYKRYQVKGLSTCLAHISILISEPITVFNEEA